jgi:hypothetical protein
LEPETAVRTALKERFVARASAEIICLCEHPASGVHNARLVIEDAEVAMVPSVVVV